MSKGPGHIQSKLLLYFKRRGYAAPVCELAQRAYGLWPRDVLDTHRVAVLRAVRLLIARGEPFGKMKSYRLGYQETIIYRTDSALSRQSALGLCQPLPREVGEEDYAAPPLRTW